MKCPSQKSEFCMVLPFVLLFLAPGIKGPQLHGWLGSFDAEIRINNGLRLSSFRSRYRKNVRRKY